jgi:hypothetical protein
VLAKMLAPAGSSDREEATAVGEGRERCHFAIWTVGRGKIGLVWPLWLLTMALTLVVRNT